MINQGFGCKILELCFRLLVNYKYSNFLNKSQGINLDYKAITVASCWLAVAVISTVYMLVFGNQIGDVFFGVFLPVGLLVFVAIAVTVFVTSKPN
jgi:hypothetical protein